MSLCKSLCAAFVICLGMTAASAQETPAGRFEKLLETEWQYGLREAPTFATYLGDTRYNNRWPDVSLHAIARRHDHQRELLATLDAFDAASLPPAERLNLKLFRRQIALEVEEYQFNWHFVPLTARDGIQDESSAADVINFARVKDYEDWLARLDAFPVYMQQTMALMREGMRTRTLQSRVVMQRVPAQIRKQIVDDPAKSLFYKPFLTYPADIPQDEQARLSATGRQAIADKVVPAYREFLKFFEAEYLPACFEEVGVWQVPRGKELYAFRVKQFTTTGLSSQEVHDIGQREVRRIRAEMEAIQKQVGYTGTFKQFLDFLRTDPQFFYENADDLLTGYLALCKRIDPQLPKLFKTLPRIPYGIEPIPMHIAPDTTTAYYRPPAADGSRAGMYFVNLYKPEQRPKWEMEALSLHEAVPGHHLQIAIATELEGLPEFRRFSSITAYIEGWGLYAESLGPELGLYQDPYSKFGQLTYEMWRAVRLVVDTGMHDLKWTRAQAIDFFRQNTAKSELDIANEVDRYIAWPGQALAYKIGELKIKALRDKAKTALDERFDLRDFHEVVLRQGAIPLDVLEDVVDEWIQSQLKPEAR